MYAPWQEQPATLAHYQLPDVAVSLDQLTRSLVVPRRLLVDRDLGRLIAFVDSTL